MDDIFGRIANGEYSHKLAPTSTKDIRKTIRYKDMYGFVGMAKDDGIDNFFGDYWLKVGIPASHPFRGVPVSLFEKIFPTPASVWGWSWEEAPRGYKYMQLYPTSSMECAIDKIQDFMEFVWVMRVNYTREDVEETIQGKVGEKPYSGDDSRAVDYLSRRFGYMAADVYPHTFGVIVPGRTGVIWEQQTEGVCCHHVHQEGTFIPIREPMSMGKYDEEKDEIVGTRYPLSEICREYYDHGGRPAMLKLLWRWVKKETYMDFDFIESPVGEIRNQEGFQWIRFTKIRDHMDRNLLGRDLILIYPNSD